MGDFNEDQYLDDLTRGVDGGTQTTTAPAGNGAAADTGSWRPDWNDFLRAYETAAPEAQAAAEATFIAYANANGGTTTTSANVGTQTTGTATQTTGTQTMPVKCYPLDCYAQCREKDKETQRMCKEANKIHVAKMKALGCNGTTCRTARLGKSCRKVKQPKKGCCTTKRRKKRC